MKFIFSTGSIYTYGIERCFDLAAAAGFDGIELMVDARWDTRQPDHLTRLMAQFGLPILAVHSPFTSSVPGWPGGNPQMIKQSVRLAEAVGAPVVVHHLPMKVGYAIVLVPGKRAFVPLPGWEMEKPYRRWLLDEYPALQASTGVTLCIENMPARLLWGRRWDVHHWNTLDEIVRFPALTMDTTHLGTWGIEPVDAWAHLGERVRHIHFSNYNGHEHRLPQDGRLQLDKLVATLARDGYGGAISYELHPDAVRAGAADRVIVELLAASLSQARAWAQAGSAERG